MYAHGESNTNRWNRNPLFYPLNYGRLRYNFYENGYKNNKFIGIRK